MCLSRHLVDVHDSVLAVYIFIRAVFSPGEYSSGWDNFSNRRQLRFFFGLQWNIFPNVFLNIFYRQYFYLDWQSVAITDSSLSGLQGRRPSEIQKS